jgi:ABC-type sugar transport system ATPase subunit
VSPAVVSAVAPLLALRGVTKRFGGVTALDGVDFDLRAGEIHALLGENGAGKSTLIKILGGIHRADTGAVVIDGAPQLVRGVSDADRLGVRIIHQELSLAANLSVAENIYLGREPGRWGLLDRRAMESDAENLIAKLGMSEIRDVRKTVAELSVASRQLVEIARALATRARILVLDEPTSSLSESETENLFATLNHLREQGVGIIYISHRLEEIMRLADRVTVLRDGHTVGTRDIGEVDQHELVRWMVGREIVDYFHRPDARPGDVALEARDLRNEKVRGVSFELRHGEILGIAGLVGAGRTELARTLFGIDKLCTGSLLVDGGEVTIRTPQAALEAGVVLIPEDRQGQGLVMIQTIAFNLALPWAGEWNPFGLPNQRRRSAIVDRAIDAFGIKISGPEAGIDSLSGGNQQKVLVSRWMEHRPKVLILDEPTRGVDVGAREEMFHIIARLVEEGMAVLLISSDLAEVLNMSHRIAVYRDGRIIETLPAASATMENVMQLLTGAEAQ